MSNVQRRIKTIGIAGAGGIGSHLAGMFFRFGVEPRSQYPFTDWDTFIYDDDTVDASNLLHQDYTCDDLGKKKAELVAARCVMTPVPKLMTPEDFPKFDVLFCGVDSMTFRKQLYEWSWANPGKLFWIDGRCTSRQGAVLNSTQSKDDLSKYLNDSQERTGCLHEFEKTSKTSHAMPMVIAAIMEQTFLNWYRGDDKIPGRLFYI